MSKITTNISNDAVVNATGNTWAEWFAKLDQRDAIELSHKEIVGVLDEIGVESSWWQQQIAVGYEQKRGLREVGETAEAGFQIGVQRTVNADRETLWTYITSATGLSQLLGPIDSLAIEPGTTYETEEGATGEIRTVSAGERLRLTWQPSTFSEPSTLQLTLEAHDNDDRTIVRVHQEKLENSDQRELMRDRWTTVLEGIKAEIAG